MKVLVLTSTYARQQGDIEPRFVDNLCQYLAKADPRNEIHVVAPHAPGIPTQEVMDGIPVFRFRYAPETWQSLAYEGGILPSLKQNRLRILLVPLFVCSQLLLALKLARINRYDVIHAHWIIPQGLVAAILHLLIRSAPPVVLTSHGGDLFALKGKLLAGLKKWIIKRAARLTVVSSAMKNKVLDQHLSPAAKLAVIPMGVETKATFHPPANDSERDGLLFVGRLVDKKGIEYLVRAMPEVLARHPATRLTVIGQGPMRQELGMLVDSLGLEDQVEFLGARLNTEVPGFLREAAITVFPSIVTASGDQEGTPVAVMEAMACGCAAVVSDYPGARDIVLDEQTGLLVEPRSAEQLADKINRLLEDEQLRQLLGANARRYVQDNYDWQVVSSAFLAEFTKANNTA